MASSSSNAARFAKAALVSVGLMAPMGLLNSERVHDAMTRWFGVGGGGDHVARYEHSSHQLALVLQAAWLLFATFLAFWWIGKSQGSPVRFALAIVMLLGLVVSPFLAHGPLTEIVAIEVTRSGHIDLLSRTKRESFPTTALRRVEGSTSTGSSGLRGMGTRTRHRVELAFADGQGQWVLREIEVWGRWDNSLTTFGFSSGGPQPQIGRVEVLVVASQGPGAWSEEPFRAGLRQRVFGRWPGAGGTLPDTLG